MATFESTVHGFGSLSQLSSLLSGNLRELPVIVAVDFEGLDNILNGFANDKNSQAGVAVFDTKILFTNNYNNMKFTATNYICGNDFYWEERQLRAQWGTVERINKCDMLRKINSTIPKNRDIVLIGHGFKFDIDCLRTLGFDFSNVKVIFDTHETSRDFNLGSFKLCDLIKQFRHLHHEKIYHTASNDAVITLQAFLELYMCASQYQMDPSFLGLIKLVTCSSFKAGTQPVNICLDFTTEFSRRQCAIINYIPPEERLGQARSSKSFYNTTYEDDKFHMSEESYLDHVNSILDHYFPL